MTELEKYEKFLKEHGKIHQEYARPYNPTNDPDEYKKGSYFVGYDLYLGEPENEQTTVAFACGDVDRLACYKELYQDSIEYLKNAADYI